MTCNEFRAAFEAGSQDAAALEHLRACDACLDHAAHLDPDVMFRAIGGAEMIPPGGVDAFAADVMRAVRLRTQEGQLVPRNVLSWPRRMAIAATMMIGVSGLTMLYQTRHTGSGQAVVHPTVAAAFQKKTVPTTTKPVVETYSSSDATIVEVPNGGSSDVQVVMIFDESLPADL